VRRGVKFFAKIVLMALKKIHLSPPDVGRLEKKLVKRAITSGWVAPTGPFQERFEKDLAKFCNRQYAVALSSGTAALHLGLIAIGVQKGDYVLCSSMTFVATANAISYVGAHPVFIDSERSSGNIDPKVLLEALIYMQKFGMKVGAILPVDFLGSIANYSEIAPLCQRWNVPMLVDAAESLGSTRGGLPSGSFGVASVFSFNGNKVLTTSGGGALVTDDPEIARKARFLSSQAREPVLHFEHEEVGFNYRMSNILASIGVAQLNRLPTMIRARRKNRARYRRLFSQFSGIRVLGESDQEDNCWLSAIVVDEFKSGFRPEELAQFLAVKGIETRPLWKPMHLQPLYNEARSFLNGTSESLFQSGLALPSGSSLTPKDWRRIQRAILSFLVSRLAQVRVK